MTKHYPVLIVGGGIVGAGIFRDLSLHKIPSLLIEKRDFSSQTSSASSKMLHGGIRYLENYDFPLVKEALHEKNLWLKLTPHLCYEEQFSIPVYQDSARPLWMIKMGLMLYDFLSSYQNSPHLVRNSQETLKHFPTLKAQGLRGSGLYCDAVVDDLKLTLEVIYDALSLNIGQAKSYTSLQHVKRENGLWKVSLLDELTKDIQEITTEQLVFATGPFTDQLLNELNIFPWENKLIPSKGSHLWIKQESLPIEKPMVLTPKDGRVIFVIPQGNRVLVGTTEIKIDHIEHDPRPRQEEIDYLISNLKEYFPKSDIKQDDIIGSFSGVRPLVKDPYSNDPGKTARDHHIFRPHKDAYVIVGGKYTTFRIMAQDIVKQLSSNYKIPYQNQLSLGPLSQKSTVLPFQGQEISEEHIKNIIDQEEVRTVDDILLRRIGNLAASEKQRLAKLIGEYKDLPQSI